MLRILVILLASESWAETSVEGLGPPFRDNEDRVGGVSVEIMGRKYRVRRKLWLLLQVPGAEDKREDFQVRNAQQSGGQTSTPNQAYKEDGVTCLARWLGYPSAACGLVRRSECYSHILHLNFLY